MKSSSLFFGLAAVALLAACSRSASPPSASEGSELRTLTLFADEPFYRERDEPEALFVGLLSRREVVTGPMDRYLPFVLDGLPVYPGGRDTQRRLERFVGLRVEIRGKRVDLTSEGFGVEIWPGTIRALSAGSGQPGSGGG